MSQSSLFHEDIWQALLDCVAALGGPKKVGVMLRPELDSDPAKAGRWLSDCLNSERSEKLCIDQLLMILREARKVGCHTGVAFINRDAGYSDPLPIEPEDEKAALQREFITSTKALSALTARLERAGMLPS